MIFTFETSWKKTKKNPKTVHFSAISDFHCKPFLCGSPVKLNISLTLAIMTSFTTLVNVDAEIATKVSLFISKLLKSELYYRECEDLIKQQNTSELIMKYLTSIDILFTIENDKGKIFI